MGEVLATVGSITAISQLTNQILSSTKLLYEFFSQIKSAPKLVSDLLHEISLQARTLESIPAKDRPALVESLVYVKKVLAELQDQLDEFKAGMERGGLKGKLMVGCVKVVWKGQVLRELVERLERARVRWLLRILRIWYEYLLQLKIGKG